MNRQSLGDVEREIHRIQQRIAAVKEELKRTQEPKFRTWPITGTAATGALRRASMDLTRALAGMRKP